MPTAEDERGAAGILINAEDEVQARGDKKRALGHGDEARYSDVVGLDGASLSGFEPRCVLEGAEVVIVIIAARLHDSDGEDDVCYRCGCQCLFTGNLHAVIPVIIIIYTSIFPDKQKRVVQSCEAHSVYSLPL